MKDQQTQQNEQARKIPLGEQQPVQKNKMQPAQRDAALRRTYHCANCDIEFFWSPTTVQGATYCCTGCAAGGPCDCDYSLYRSVTILGVIYYEQ